MTKCHPFSDPVILQHAGPKMDLKQVNVTQIKRIGDKTAKCLKKLHVESVNDLLWYVPRSYIKYPEIIPFSGIHDLEDGQIVAVYGTVNRDYSENRYSRVLISTFTIHDASRNNSSIRLKIVFFGQSYVKNIFYPGKSFVFYGKIKKKRFRLQHGNARILFPGRLQSKVK